MGNTLFPSPLPHYTVARAPLATIPSASVSTQYAAEGYGTEYQPGPSNRQIALAGDLSYPGPPISTDYRNIPEPTAGPSSALDFSAPPFAPSSTVDFDIPVSSSNAMDFDPNFQAPYYPQQSYANYGANNYQQQQPYYPSSNNYSQSYSNSCNSSQQPYYSSSASSQQPYYGSSTSEAFGTNPYSQHSLPFQTTYPGPSGPVTSYPTSSSNAYPSSTSFELSVPSNFGQGPFTEFQPENVSSEFINNAQPMPQFYDQPSTSSFNFNSNSTVTAEQASMSSNYDISKMSLDFFDSNAVPSSIPQDQIRSFTEDSPKHYSQLLPLTIPDYSTSSSIDNYSSSNLLKVQTQDDEASIAQLWAQFLPQMPDLVPISKSQIAKSQPGPSQTKSPLNTIFEQSPKEIEMEFDSYNPVNRVEKQVDQESDNQWPSVFVPPEITKATEVTEPQSELESESSLNKEIGDIMRKMPLLTTMTSSLYAQGCITSPKVVETEENLNLREPRGAGVLWRPLRSKVPTSSRPRLVNVPKTESFVRAPQGNPVHPSSARISGHCNSRSSVRRRLDFGRSKSKDLSPKKILTRPTPFTRPFQDESSCSAQRSLSLGALVSSPNEDAHISEAGRAVRSVQSEPQIRLLKRKTISEADSPSKDVDEGQVSKDIGQVVAASIEERIVVERRRQITSDLQQQMPVLASLLRNENVDEVQGPPDDNAPDSSQIEEGVGSGDVSDGQGGGEGTISLLIQSTTPTPSISKSCIFTI